MASRLSLIRTITSWVKPKTVEIKAKINPKTVEEYIKAMNEKTAEEYIKPINPKTAEEYDLLVKEADKRFNKSLEEAKREFPEWFVDDGTGVLSLEEFIHLDH